MADAAENKQFSNHGDNRDRNNRKKHFYHNGNYRNNRYNQNNNRSGNNQNRYDYKKNEKPVETAADIATETARLEKEIALEINEIKSIDVTF